MAREGDTRLSGCGQQGGAQSEDMCTLTSGGYPPAEQGEDSPVTPRLVSPEGTDSLSQQDVGVGPPGKGASSQRAAPRQGAPGGTPVAQPGQAGGEPHVGRR